MLVSFFSTNTREYKTKANRGVFIVVYRSAELERKIKPLYFLSVQFI